LVSLAQGNVSGAGRCCVDELEDQKKGAHALSTPGIPLNARLPTPGSVLQTYVHSYTKPSAEIRMTAAKLALKFLNPDKAEAVMSTLPAIACCCSLLLLLVISSQHF
jgi:hypothetical protein